ncbi:ATP-binding protein [Variovorax sp. LT1P1]|uniref:ATP-binding protein n=1 Tax=Variovorax sp. LT1P1 TaxID=3443730 RepID=UPI003F46F671
MKKPISWLPRAESIQARLGLAFGILVLGVSVALAMLMARAAEEQVLRQSAANMEVLTRQLARELSSGMDRFAQAVLTQTYRDRFREPSTSASSMRRALDEFVQTNPEFAYVSIVDVQTEKVAAANGGIFEGGSASGRPTFEEGRRGLFIGDVHDAVRLAELLPKPPNGEALRFLDVAAPIRDNAGNVIRVFASHVAWKWTDGLRADIFGPLKASHGIEAVLVDTKGKVVLAAASDLAVGSDLQAMSRRAGQSAEVIRWPNGADYLTTVTATAPQGDFPGFGWTVIARQPATLAASAAAELRTAFLVGAIILGCAGAVLAWWASARLLQPMRELAQTARDVQAGHGLQADTGFQDLSEVASVKRTIGHLLQRTRSETEARGLSERQFATLADSLPQRVFQTNAQGLVDLLNQAWANAQTSSTALRGQPLPALFSNDLSGTLEPVWQRCLATGEALDIRCELQPIGEASARWHDVKARLVHDTAGVASAWIGTLADIHHTVVDAQNARQALSLERSARVEAEEVTRMRDEFLAIVSHELRSPLNVIAGWAEILARKSPENPTVLKAADVIRTSVRQQAALVDDLMDITAVAAGKLVLKLEAVDVAKAATEVVTARVPAAEAKGLLLHCEVASPAVIEGDGRRVVQMISNLVDNAIKFTDRGGQVVVAVSAEHQTCRVTVKDSGHGITPEFLPYVFDHMRQEDSSKTRRSGGLGLGLAIVKGLATLHRGTIDGSSEGKGQGATFTLRLPLQSLAVPAEQMQNDSPSEEAIQPTDLRGCRVLLVDDEADAREMTQVALTSLGATVHVAASGAEVLRLIHDCRFDVLVSDIGMPDMDGLTLVRHVREDFSSLSLPAVALTAFVMESDRQAALAAGFQAYLTKPITLPRLAHAVASVRVGKARASANS